MRTRHELLPAAQSCFRDDNRCRTGRRGGATTDEGTKTCTQNHVFVLPPYAPHSIFASQPYTLLNICIDKTKAAGAARGDVASLLTQVLHSEEKSAELLRLLDCENAFTACCGGRHLKAQNPFISALKDHLEDAPEQPQSVGELARSAYLSKYQFIRAFKAQVGLTPHRFQMQNRIRKAKRLLRSTATMTQVALDTGFCCINFANSERPSAPAMISCGMPAGKMEIIPSL